MPETLPTVTSSIITGELCGSVATSAKSTVIEYEPDPWPDVPGSATEFNPPNWQPASSALPATNAPPRNKIRFIGPPPARPATASPAAGARVRVPAAGRRACSPAPARRARAQPGEPSAPGDRSGWTGAHRVPGPSADPESGSATW